MNWRTLVTLLLAVVLVATGFGYLLGRRPTTNERALERRIGELVVENRQLEADRDRVALVAQEARREADRADATARAAEDRAAAALAYAAGHSSALHSDSTVDEDSDTSILQAELDLAGQIIDTLTVALTDTRNALVEARYAAGRLRGAVDSLTLQGQRDSTQIAALEQTLTSLRAVQPGRPLLALPGGTFGKIAGALAVGFVAGALVTQ